jgi:serine/threonine protein kinase
MGEVYRARDTRLDRIVAIKVLPPAIVADDRSRARFERESHAISALSHPNICALYDVGRDGDAEYLVMEYLEGETLARKIDGGPLPLNQVLRFGAQIAGALHHAHRAGITHRDLKPANVMITKNGAKLLDFGLAKFIESSMPGPDTQSPTTALDPLTAEGTIVGTYQYMSPEQLQGKPLDHRTDIFSLGVILYEMATGQRPFEAQSRAGVIAAILSSEVIPIHSRQPAFPAAVERIILTALEKDPEERWQTAQDIARQLRWNSEPSSVSEHTAALPQSRRRAAVVTSILVASLLAAGLTWGGMRWWTPRPPPAKAHLHISLPPEMRPTEFYESAAFALSPDGRTLCFVATTGTAEHSLFLRDIDSYALRKIEGSGGASGPFWSSDGHWIGFSARNKLWKTRILGGTGPVALCDVAQAGAMASWQGHTILFCDASHGRPEIFRVSDSGGKPLQATHLTTTRHEWRHSWPYLLPDGEHFLYQSHTADSIDRQLIFASLKSAIDSVVLRNVSQVRLLGDQLIFVRDAKLLLQHFNAATGTMIGDAAAIATDVRYFYPAARGDFDAAGGTVVYRTDTSTGRLTLVNRKGVETRLIDGKNIFFDFGLSRDGGRAAVSVLDRATSLTDLWIYDLARGVRDPFTTEPWLEVSPVWSPDGFFIVYSEAGGAFPHIVRREVTGSKSIDVGPRGPFQYAKSFSPDGETLFFVKEDAASPDKGQILRMDMRTGKADLVLDAPFCCESANVSPDAKWLAFTSTATGRSEVYLMNLADARPRIRISTATGYLPQWRADGRELFYVTSDAAIVSVMPGPSGKWDDATSRDLFRKPLRSFAPLPDGQSFLLTTNSPGAEDSLYHVIMGVQ